MNGELRATYVDADEARMLRAMRRFRGDDASREIGNKFSQTNRTRIAALAERNAHRPPQPKEPPPQPARLGLEPKTSRRAIHVPKVGRPQFQRPAAIDVMPMKGRPAHTVTTGTGEVRPDYSAYEPAPLPPYVPPAETREIQVEKLQDRITYGENAPSRIPKPRQETRAPRAPPSEHEQARMLADSISQEIDERRHFLEDMNALGKGKAYDAQIRGEIAERLQELKRLEALLSSQPAPTPDALGAN